MTLFTGKEKNVPSHEQQPLLPREKELANRVRRFLNDRVPDCDDLIVEERGCTVILRGRVMSDHTKRLCLKCSQYVAGVIHVIDELNVPEESASKTIPLKG